MVNNSFISVVCCINHREDLPNLELYLRNVSETTTSHFSHYEIIIVNNLGHRFPHEIVEPLPENIKKNIFLLELSNKTSRNNAILAGLERSNGDYTILFEIELFDQSALIVALYEKTKEQFDMVYLRNKQRPISLFYRLFYKIFYTIIKNYSDLGIDENALDSRIISRRALNSLLRLRENLRYMKAIYSIVGYNTTYLEYDFLNVKDRRSFGDKFKTSLVAITSYTSFLRSMLLWIFIFSLLFLITVVYNAIKVKLTGEDIFGNIGEAVPGWAFLVLLISVFFAVMCLNLYIMSIYLSNIYQEIKQRPPYIIESVKRF